ncbi:hypothetical protein N0B31_17595 [Salinirubellus salinus]|uniref:DUF7573 domain-containing protein n=1 Tax=Salinirubellus salinus TaxID=1364945 RepID=A0A9E7UAD8_9EURY|nr:hypothetical protein [Salinirubellus salinus]UWM53927.1 hypothetical protein N0B31_17595 [Salinirubellus salinus]
MPNRSLDDFVGGTETDEDPTSDADEVAESEAESELDATETEVDEGDADAAVESDTDAETDTGDSTDDEPTLTVEEATPTYDFSPEGATCESCGETVETRWHDPEVGMVCAECKGW